jgi:hypothetical protein
MPACETCGADTLLMVNVALGAAGPKYAHRCPQGHITQTDFRSPPPGTLSPDVVDAPATSPPPPPVPPDGEVAGSPSES